MDVPVQDTHPAGDTLAAFALGHLDDEQAVVVAEHLGVCAHCRQAVLAVPDDSMLSLLRPGASTPVPRPELLDTNTVGFMEGVPPELHEHARYRVQKRLGAGGMGVVFQAEHRLMERTVALKVIRPQFTASPAAIERFRREVRAAARLSHPNLVQAHDAEQAGELHFLVMEFVEGETLSERLERDGPLPIATACDYVRQAAQGLAHAQAQGLVHRDIKPHNLMVTTQGQVKVLDFGLASIAVERGGAAGLTHFGQGMGTPDYMAPEQVRDARSVDTRADIYSLGCTLYHLLTGRPPFPDGNVGEKMAAHLEKQPTPPDQLRAELPSALVQVIARMMAKEPAQRYQTPADIVTALAPFCRSQVPTATAEEHAHAERHASSPAASEQPGYRLRLSPPRRKRLLAICLLLFMLGLTFVGGVLTIRTKNGTIVLSDLPRDAEVLVDGDKVSVKTNGNGLIEIQVPAGKRTLEFRRNGVKFEAEEVMLAAGELKPITVRRVPNPPEASKEPPPVVAAQAKPVERAPDLSKVMPLIDDDFSEPEQSHFPAFQDKGVSVGHFDGGRYVLRRHHPRGFCAMDAHHAVEGAFACQVVGRTLQQGPGWGIRFASVSGDGDQLAVRLRRDGVVDVGTVVRGDDILVPIRDPIRHPAIQSGDEFNTLLVIVRPEQWLEIYVNGSAIGGPIKLKKPLPRRVVHGILWWSRDAEFKRYTVWLLPPPAPLPRPGESSRPPDLSTVKPRIDDDFRDPDHSWFAKGRNDAGGWEMFFDNGGYVLHQFFRRSPEHWGHDRYTTAVPEEAVTGDLAVQVKGRVLTKRDNGWTVGLFTPKQDRDVAVRLRWDGAVEVGNYLWSGQSRCPVTMVGPIRHPAIHAGDKANTLLVILRGGQRLEIYVNGTAVTGPIELKESLGPVVCPGVGLWERTGHREYKARAEFRRFTVWELPPSAAPGPR